MSRLSNLCNSRGSMPRKKYSPFAGSSVCSYCSLTKDETFLVAMFVVSVRRNIFQEIVTGTLSRRCCEGKAKFCANIRWCPFEGKASSEDEIVASSFGLIAIFFRHSPDSQLFQEENFESRRLPK